MENLTGNGNKKSTTTSKNDKTERKRWNMLWQKKKKATQQVKQTAPLEEINKKVLTKERRQKDIEIRSNNTGKIGHIKTTKKTTSL